MKKLVHIVNPFSSSNNALYEHTFESMRVAQAFSKAELDVILCKTGFNSDREVKCHGFVGLSNLTKSVCDVNPSLRGKKLPLIADILYKLRECANADYYIYSNTDIALMPYFYDVVHRYIHRGHDAIVINRRRLSKNYESEPTLEMMYADLGKSHPGFDCFIFKKELLDKFELDEICVGIPFLEVALLHNIVAFAQNPKYVLDAHLTFHIGLDVMPARNKDYYWHNRNTYFKKIAPKLKPHLTISKFPYAYLPWPKRALKWVLNPSMFTVEYLQLEIKGITNKLNEIRWRILQR